MGLRAVPAAVRDAPMGMGFAPRDVKWRIELPLAFPFILAGLRNAVIVNIGTAAIGSAAGALSLGSPIIEGLSASNPAYVLEGAAIVALLAMAVDRCFAWLEDFARPGEMRPKSIGLASPAVGKDRRCVVGVLPKHRRPRCGRASLSSRSPAKQLPVRVKKMR